MRKSHKEAMQGILYVLPSFILILTFSLIPIIMNVYFSFTKYNILQPAKWVGMANYVRMFQDEYVWASLKNTAVFTFVTVPVQTILSLVLAAVIAELFRNKFGNFVKSSLFVPVIASAVLVGTLWAIILSPSGAANSIIEAMGGKSVNWLGGKNTALLSVCIATVWKNVGYFLVIYFAGIMDIPRSLYEAAEVDGATAVQKFFRITLPSLSSVTFLVVTLGTIWSFQVFDMVYTMTGGGPGLSTVTLVLTIYNTAFKEYNMGYASAIALLMFVFVLLISGGQKLLLRGGKGEDA
ncbi:MAG: sugar ABC transporter permease [Ruthenibacterium sp.]